MRGMNIMIVREWKIKEKYVNDRRYGGKMEKIEDEVEDNNERKRRKYRRKWKRCKTVKNI